MYALPDSNLDFKQASKYTLCCLHPEKLFMIQLCTDHSYLPGKQRFASHHNSSMKMATIDSLNWYDIDRSSMIQQ